MAEPRGPEQVRELVATDLAHVIHPYLQHRALERRHPLVVVSARGAVVVDAYGREYLDCMAGLFCVNVGYGREELARVAKAQMEQLAYFPHTHINEPAARFAARLADLLAGPYHIYFTNSGTEANEVLFKLARQFWKQQPGGEQRDKIVGRYMAYHGTSLATLAAGGMPERKNKFAPMPQGFVHVAPPYCYRCPFGLGYPSCGLACVKNLEFTIQAEGPETVAAVVAEPVMSAMGALVPPAEYWPEVQAVCRRYGILLLIDEVINGFGRTGTMFAHQHWGLQPDGVALAKGISSAYLPLAAAAVTDRVFQGFLGEPEEKKHAVQINTYGGHPVACAVGLANLDILVAEGLAGRAREIGAYLLAGLQQLAGLPAVGDVRGKGLLLGVELVADQATRAPAPARLVNQVADGLLARGLLVGKSAGTVGHLGNAILLSPPLVLTRDEADRIIQAFTEVLSAVPA